MSWAVHSNLGKRRIFMEKKWRVGIIGATGMVGQQYVRLLAGHPWFRITHLGASRRSAGNKYRDIVADRWQMDVPVPGEAGDLTVYDASEIGKAVETCDFVFSAVNLDKPAIRNLEEEYAKNDLPVVSNNSAHRGTTWVPMIIPEVNPEHLDLIPRQQKKQGWKKGFIVTKPNCSIQPYMLPLAAFRACSLEIEALHTSNYQALSGAGYPGVSALDVTDNIYHLSGEEEKNEREPKKIFGRINGDAIDNTGTLTVSADCVRVGVQEGHMSNVCVLFRREKPVKEELVGALVRFSSLPQELNLPSAPNPPIVYFEDVSRPQPRKDRWTGGGMAVAAGRLRECPVFHWKFTALTSNTVRGAAGGAVLTAELLAAKGWITKG
jgi:aspartate-semialdehyde dehydrogenase